MPLFIDWKDVAGSEAMASGGETAGRLSNENMSATGAGGGGAGAETGTGAEADGRRRDGGTRFAGRVGGRGIPARACRMRCMATANSSLE